MASSRVGSIPQFAPPEGFARRRALWGMASGVWMIVGCGNQETVDKPSPPDMAALVSAYLEPDGVFDQAVAKSILTDYADRAEQLGKLGVEQVVMASLRDALDDAASEASTSQASGGPGTSRQELRLDADGTMRITRICNGWATEPVVDEGNGSLVLRVNFSEDGLDPVVWGDARACRYLVGGVEVELNELSGRQGDLRLWLGNSATFKNFGEQAILFDLDLVVAVAGTGTQVATSFQVDPVAKKIAIALDTDSGKVVVSSDGSHLLSVAAGNGDFGCDLTLGQCTSDAGQSFGF